MTQDVQKYVRSPMTNNDLRAYLNNELAKIQQATDTFATLLGNLSMLSGVLEGEFIPVAIGQTTAGVGTYTIQKGRYLKIGRAVFFSFVIGWTAHTGTGNIAFTGLPYNTSNSIATDFPVLVGNGIAPLNAVATTVPNSGTLQVSQAGHATGQNMIAAWQVCITGVYFSDT
jgi:hypothetical protein